MFYQAFGVNLMGCVFAAGWCVTIKAGTSIMTYSVILVLAELTAELWFETDLGNEFAPFRSKSHLKNFLPSLNYR